MQQLDLCLDWMFEPVTGWDKCISVVGHCAKSNGTWLVCMVGHCAKSNVTWLVCMVGHCGKSNGNWLVYMSYLYWCSDFPFCLY
jgi:hypothetical protein